jgi:hypothetical protein
MTQYSPHTRQSSVLSRQDDSIVYDRVRVLDVAAGDKPNEALHGSRMTGDGDGDGAEHSSQAQGGFVSSASLKVIATGTSSFTSVWSCTFTERL